MAKRYGRNQKSRHRQEVAALSEALSRSNANAAALARRARGLEDATSNAVNRILASEGSLHGVLEMIASEIGAQLGEELRPAAEKIMKSLRPRYDRVFDVSAARDPREGYLIVRGSLVADYAVVVY